MSDVEFNSDAARRYALKILLMLLVFVLPFILVYLFKGYMVNLWGEPSPTNPFYLTLVGALVLWFIVGYVIIIRRVGRQK